ncbi:MAG: alkaline phosphatase family protein [Geodermatophilaceae bacterium]|nr:alkaline phosphatase family protein [Geodermatophilaceae bacterium]
MAQLVLGPLLRHVDETSATIWVETDAPCEVEILGSSADTFHVAGHHYALVVVEGLQPASSTPYEVIVEGNRLWPESASAYPPSRIRTLGHGNPISLVFGSCRWARPATAGGDRSLPPDALDTYATRMASAPEETWPDALLLLGDQVYADETTSHTQTYLRHRRDVEQPPWTEVADFEEYTHLYLESWTDPDVRWLLSTIPTSMIFDDHDVRDDWNTSHIWREQMQATGWWQERIEGALMSYWIYQQLGNLAPSDLATDELFAAVCAAGDGAALLRAFAKEADAEADGAKSTRWSYRRDFGRVRLLVIDTRCGRILADGARSMLSDHEFEWIEQQAGGDVDHLLIGSSLPWLMAHALHDVEAWNEHLCTTYDGRLVGRLSEKFRQGADMEHWGAFGASFRRLAGLFADVGSRDGSPATICVLSGDVHHAYVAEALYPDPPRSKVYQLTCSPVHNMVPGFMKIGFRVGWSRLARAISRRLTRLFRVAAVPIDWVKLDGPHFDNQLATLRLAGRSASVRFERTELGPDGPRLARASDVDLTNGGA